GPGLGAGGLGRATQPRRAAVEVGRVVVVFAKPAALPLMELVGPPTRGTKLSPVFWSIALMPATSAPVTWLQVSVPFESPVFPVNDSAATPMFPPLMVLSDTVASPSSSAMPSKRLLVSVLPLMLEVPVW